MTENGKRSVNVGQTAKHRGTDCEITNIAPDGDNVKVTYPFSPSKRPMWVRLEDLTFPETLSTSPNTSPVPELYPVGDVFTNQAGESVKVIDCFQNDRKLQLGALVGGALATDFQPSDDEPVIMSVGDVTIWLEKQYKPGDIVELKGGRIERILKTNLNGALSDEEKREYQIGTRYGTQGLRKEDMTPFGVGSTYAVAIRGKIPEVATPASQSEIPPYAWIPGQRARLLKNLPDDRWPLSEGDEGTIVLSGGEFGFYSDRYKATAKVRSLNGKTVRVVDECEAVIADSLTPEVVDVPEVDNAVAKSADSKDEQIKFLQKQIEGLLLDNKLLNREHDELMQAREDNGKLMAALEDAQRSIRQLEKKNNQQSEMLRSAVQPVSVTAAKPDYNRIEVKTLLQQLSDIPSGSATFTGYEDEQLARHLNDGWDIINLSVLSYHDGAAFMPNRVITLQRICTSPTPHETRSEKVTVEFETPQNSFEDLLRGNAPAIEIQEEALQPSLMDKLKADKPIFAAIAEHGIEAVQAALDDKVLSAARAAYENALIGTNWQPKRFERLLTTGEVNSDKFTHETDVIEVMVS